MGGCEGQQQKSYGKQKVILCLFFFFWPGRYIRTNLNMPHSLPQRSGGFRDYEKDAPITVFGCMQARLVGKCPGVTAQPFLATCSKDRFQWPCQDTFFGFLQLSYK